MRQAIEYARIFDTAAAIFFPGCFASRRNYDIAQGRDGNGRERFGVLEQSWRVGGASSAEIAALEAFRADPGLPAGAPRRSRSTKTSACRTTAG